MSPSLFFLADVLVHATPLILTGLAVAIAFRAGVWNIGADGQFLAGATMAAWIGVSAANALDWLTLPAAIVAGAIGGALWAAIAARLRSRFGVLEVISTIMLNFVAAYGVSYLVRGPLQEPTHVYPQTSSIAEWARIGVIVPGTRLHWGFVLALVLALTAGWMARSTVIGFRLRATGGNPFAARSAGSIDVGRVATRAFIVSGAIAGVAGAVEVCGVTFALYENISPGYGYTAIAVALLAALDPRWVIVTGLVFGALEAGAGALQRDMNIPSTVASVIEALVILVLVGVSQWRGYAARRRAVP
ncbi:MAG TPA: ABC transporter permease, partial [Candidatus Elarobacter sp.]|nr:ABC transporter permease [Candidatus Elarobacter sp.]